MRETLIVTIRIDDGVITEVTEDRTGTHRGVLLTERGDIEDAVARVANTPVAGGTNCEPDAERD